jgi:hypothetical protein
MARPPHSFENSVCRPGEAASVGRYDDVIEAAEQVKVDRL